MFANMKFKWEGQPIPLTPPMLAIAAAGDDAAGSDDAANEDNVAVNEAAGSAAEAPLVPHSTPVSPVRRQALRQDADAAGRAEDPVLLTSLFDKLDSCGHTVVGDVPAAEGDVDIQDDVDLDGLSRMASAALGHDQPAVPSADVEEREEEEVPLRLSAYTGLLCLLTRERLLCLILDIPAEFIAEDAQARKASKNAETELDDLMMRMTETDWLNLMMQVGKEEALADLRYRALKGKPMKQSEVTQMMRNLVKNQWCAAHNGTITMTAVKAMTKQQLIEEYEYICRRLEKDRLLSAQYNLFRPKPAITEPPSKRQRVERGSSQSASVSAATTLHADDSDSAGGGSSKPAGSATPMTGSAASNTAGGTFGATVTDSTVITTAALDPAGSHRTIGVSPFAESAAGGINEFFLDSDEDEQIGMSRVAADPDSDDEVLAEIIFRGKSISGDGVVFVDKLPDDEIVDPRVKVETVSDYASSPPRSRRKHRGVRSDDFLWDKTSKTVRREKTFTYLKELLPHVYREDLLLLRRRMNRLTVPPSYCRDVVVAGSVIQTVQTSLRQSFECLASAPFACTARQMVFSSPWLTAKKESGSPLQTALWLVQEGTALGKDSSNPLMVARLPKTGWYSFSMFLLDEKWLVQEGTALELASPEQTATGKDVSNPLYGCDGLPKTVRVFQFTLDSRLYDIGWVLVTPGLFHWKLLFFDVATSTNSAVHRVHAVSFDAAVLDGASTVSAACIFAAGYLVSAGICFCYHSILLLREDLSRNLELTVSKPSLGEDCWELLKTTKCRFC
ncbi:hypothetical protein Tco_0819828 [Tanacetum coccineum]|uniref:Uncharacterized protein n=1 Tax=Tanacetum coccineum TaxID=301880 RepID=A0ABQ5ACE9_9ASTR